MHRLARRAGYPSDSSRADRQQPRARPAGRGPLIYNYAGDLLRHLRHCPGRYAAGRCHLCARPRAGPGEKPPSPPRPPERARARCPTVTVPGPPVLARARCPAEDYSASSGEPSSATAPGRRSAPGTVPGRAAARPGGPGGPLTVPHVAVRLVFTRAFGRAGSPDCSAARGPVASCTAAARWEQFRAGSVTEDRRSGPCSVWSRRARRGQECGPAPELPRKSRSLHRPRAAVAGPAGGPGRPESAGS